MCVGGGQKIQVKNLDILQKATISRPKGTPLVTVSNHASCLDDPAVWGELIFVIISMPGVWWFVILAAALFPTLTAVNSFKIRWWVWQSWLHAHKVHLNIYWT